MAACFGGSLPIKTLVGEKSRRGTSRNTRAGAKRKLSKTKVDPASGDEASKQGEPSKKSTRPQHGQSPEALACVEEDYPTQALSVSPSERRPMMVEVERVVDPRQEILGFLNQLLASRPETIRHKLFLTMKEAAEYSGLPRTVIRRLISRNKLPAVKAGGWRIKRKYLEQLDLRHIRSLSDPDT